MHDQPATRVRFSAGARREIGEEAARLAIARPLVVTTEGRRELGEEIASAAAANCAALFPKAVIHTPVGVTEEAVAVARSLGVDGIIAVGGGSAIGLGKAIALRTGLPIIAVPTTYSGSEATPILGETEGGRKTTLRSPSVLPKTIIYDVDLVATLPPRLAGASGINAIAHAVEALYAENANPLLIEAAATGISGMASALPQIVANPDDLAAREQALWSSWLCGVCLGALQMGLHHRLCHVLGGTFDLPHADTHAIVLPYVIRYNEAVAPAAIERVARSLGVDDAATGLKSLAASVGVPGSLQNIGMPERGIDQAAALVVDKPCVNPRQLDLGSVRQLIDSAWKGERP